MMQTAEQRFPSDFESSEVTNLVGVTPIYLNKFVERRQYGITPSVRTGKGRGRRRRFSEEDLFGIALVWWLFESGLRSRTIQLVLNQICDGRPRSAASAAAKKLMGQKGLEITFPPRWSAEQDLKPSVKVVGYLQTPNQPGAEDESVLVIPIGKLFGKLRENIEALQQTIQGG